MSQVLINQYLAKLDRIKKIGGSDRECSVRTAFERLLGDWGGQRGLILIAEHRHDSATKTSVETMRDAPR